MSETQQPWYLDAVFYELYIRAYRDNDGDGHGDIAGVIEKLDYIKSLGVDCIWLLPFYPSPLKDDGYDIADYYNIHNDYGTIEDFDRLVHEAHERGLRVIVDLVVNHTSDQHPWFIESRASKDNAKRGWYVWSDTDEKWPETRIIFLDTEDSNWAYDEGTDQYYWHRFYSSQPDLNYDNPEVRQEMIDIMLYWLSRGIDGFRVDAVPYLIERDSTINENLPETHDYLKEMRTALDAHYPDGMMLCEANQPPSDVVEYFGEGDEFHMAFHFPLMPRIFMAMRSRQTMKLRQIMEETPPIPPGTQWCTFLRNHDELTLEMVTPGEREWMWQEYAANPRMRLNLGIRRRLAPLLDNNLDKIMLTHRILFSLRGSPILYYGDEIGMGDNIWLDDRDGVRTPMQWDDRVNAGFSEATSTRLYSPIIDDPTFGYQSINVEAQENDPGSLLHQMRGLIHARRARSRLFSLGITRFLDNIHPSLLTFIRENDGETVLVIHNVSDNWLISRVMITEYAGCHVINLLAPGENFPAVTDGPYETHIGPYQSHWLLLEE